MCTNHYKYSALSHLRSRDNVHAVHACRTYRREDLRHLIHIFSLLLDTLTKFNIMSGRVKHTEYKVINKISA